MGRSSHKGLPYAYTFLPTFIMPDLSGAVTLIGPRFEYPFGSGQDFTNAGAQTLPSDPKHHGAVRSRNFGGQQYPDGPGGSNPWSTVSPAPVAAVAVSATSVTDADASLEWELLAKSSGPSQKKIFAAPQGLAAGTNPVALIQPGMGDSSETGPMLADDDDSITPFGATHLMGMSATGTAGDVVTGLGANLLCSSDRIQSRPANVVLAGGPNEGTHHPYPAIGALTTFVLHEADLASSQSSTAIRKFKAPCAMRVLKVTYGCEATGADNSLALENTTQGVSIADALTTAAAGSYEVEPDDAVFNMANRDIAYNDELSLLGVTVGTGFTNAWCMVTAYITGLPWDGADPFRRVVHDTQDSNHPTTEAQATALLDPSKHKVYSGPAVGGYAAFYIGREDTGVSASLKALQSVIAPFDMEVHVVQLGASIGGAGGQLKVVNTTKGTDVCPLTAYTETSAILQGVDVFLSTPVTVNRGDVLTVTATTAAVDLTDAQAILVGRTLGFPYASAALD